MKYKIQKRNERLDRAFEQIAIFLTVFFGLWAIALIIFMILT